MTIEEKAKAYDEVREKIALRFGSNVAEEIFSEFEESEDERISKGIKSILEHYKESGEVVYPYPFVSIDEALSWLEKQGKQKKEYTFKSLPHLLDMIEPTRRAKTYCQKLIDTLVKEGYATDAKIVGESLKIMNGEDVPMAIMDENQDEHKLYGQREKCSDCQFNYAGECKGSCQMKRNEQKHDNKIEPKFKVNYAGSEYNVLKIKNIAGVTFYGIEDEPNHIDYVLPINCEIIRDHSYDVKENGCSYSTKSVVFSENKPVWSEEDDEFFNDTITFLKNSKNALDHCDWLESLKDRIQPMKKWSEKDEDYINDLIKYFSQNEKLKNIKEDIVIWLKSLKEKQK